MASPRDPSKPSGEAGISSLRGPGSESHDEPALSPTAYGAGPARDVLVIDDDPWVRVLVERLLGAQGFRVTSAPDGTSALEQVRAGFRGVVVLDVMLPDIDGSRLLRQLREGVPEMPVILLTGRASTELALDSIREGAFDFVEKVQLSARLPAAVDAAWRQLESVGQQSPFAGIVARSAAMRSVFRAVVHALPSRVPVLIRGESGTGKELVARALHANGPRRDGPFVAINCAGIPDNLLEAELFGYERGAFTGATARKLGRFDLARNGTLFLDEIGDMPVALQAKLLRVLQEGEFTRLGGVETLRADVRVVSATHRDLEEAAGAGRFREDLYYRLSVYTVTLPPLRERAGDIPELARHFVRVCAGREGKPVVDIDPRVLEVLDGYRFPGNVRELENLMAHAVVAARGPVVGLADLPNTFLRAVTTLRRRDEESTGDFAPRPEAPRIDPPRPTRPPEETRWHRAPEETRAAAGRTAEETLPLPTRPRPEERHAEETWRAPARPLDTVEHGTWPGRAPDPPRAEETPRTPGRFLTLREMERRHVADAIKLAAGNKAEAARLLGVSRMTLYRILKELEAEPGSGE